MGIAEETAEGLGIRRRCRLAGDQPSTGILSNLVDCNGLVVLDLLVGLGFPQINLEETLIR